MLELTHKNPNKIDINTLSIQNFYGKVITQLHENKLYILIPISSIISNSVGFKFINYCDSSKSIGRVFLENTLDKAFEEVFEDIKTYIEIQLELFLKGQLISNAPKYFLFNNYREVSDFYIENVEIL